ncbi:uncharacterized protein LOC135928788 [Gordionus sp. m RMFG-2023]|uniref:uncharacterized protein LOC135928788 n=1 Tax=Gordionus sp. m RMFG-2023 TaxID=3053472 RepID=UPI0031FC7E1A
MFNTVMQVKRLEGLNGTLSISIGRKTVQEPIFGNIIITSERGTDKRHYVLQHNGYYLEDSVIHHDLRNPNRYLEGSNKRFILKLEQDEKPNAAIIKRRELVNGALVILRDSETLRQQVFGYIEITTFTVHMVICRRGLTSIYKCENENGDIIYTTEENAEKVINEYLNNTDHRIRTLNLLIGITLGNENVTLALDQDENLKNAGHWWNSDVTVKRLENINGVLIMSTGNKIYYEPVLGFIDLISSNKQAKYLFHLQQYVRNVMICRKHDNFTFICDKDNGHVISTTLGRLELDIKNYLYNVDHYIRGRHSRHSAVNGTILRALSSAQIPATLEPCGLSTENNTAYTCIDRFAPSFNNNSFVRAENSQINKYTFLTNCNLVSIVSDTTGFFGNHALTFFKSLGKKIRAITGDPRKASISDSEYLLLYADLTALPSTALFLDLLPPNNNISTECAIDFILDTSSL